MKAIRYHGPRDMRYEEVDMPRVGPDDVLIRVGAAGLCATDLEVYDGVMFYFTSGMTRTPLTTGHEWAGEVVDLGEEAAFIEPTGVALYATKLAQTSPADTVAVMGPGPIGLFMVQTARAYGARHITLVGTRDDRLEVGRRLGADLTVNVRRESLVDKVRDATDGHMIDVALEAVGQPSVWGDIASILAPRARVAMTGLFAGETCAVDFDPLVIGNISILGSLGSPNCWDEAIDLHERGKVAAAPLITHHLPLEQFVDGIEIMRHRTDGAIKVVLKP